MNNTTPWYASKTIWAGALGMLVPLVGMLLHVTVSDATVQEVATDLSLIGGAVAGLGAVYYRIKASQPIAGTKAASVQAVAGNTNPIAKGS